MGDSSYFCEVNKYRMKAIQAPFIRTLFSVIIGVLLIKYREETVTWMTILIGILFFLSGLISCVTYFVVRQHATDTVVYDSDGVQLSGRRPVFPIVGLGSMIFGAVLTFMPATFVVGLTYVLAAILILGAINQFATLAAIRQWVHVSFVFWLPPCVVLLIGGVAIVKPSWIASAPLLILGWTMVLYGVIECIGALKLAATNKKYDQTAAEQLPDATQEPTEAPDSDAQQQEEA